MMCSSQRDSVINSGIRPRGDDLSLSSVSASSAHGGLEQACVCAKIANDYRGRDTVVLDLKEVTRIFDYFVITTGISRRQMQAIAEEVDRVMSSMGSERLGLEGYREGSWIVQDYGDIVLHVFTEDTRETYHLEDLWGDANRVDWKALVGHPQASTPGSGS